MLQYLFEKLNGSCPEAYDFTAWHPDDAHLPMSCKAKKKTRIAFAILFTIPFNFVMLYLGAMLAFIFYETSSYIYLIFTLFVILIWQYSLRIICNLLFRHPAVTIHSDRVEWIDKTFWTDRSWVEPLSMYLGLASYQHPSFQGVPGDCSLLLLHKERAKTIILYTCSHLYKQQFFEVKTKDYEGLLSVDYVGSVK